MEETKPVVAQAAGEAKRPGRFADRGSMRGGGRRKPQREDDGFDQRLIDLARVTRVMAGGKRMRFRACVVIGDRKGHIGWSVAKGADVSMAIQKAVTAAKKNLMTVSIVNDTIPHEVKVKFKAARVLLKPARKGTGLIAGGVIRSVLELAGIQNIVSKILGSNNKINNVTATFKALSQLRRVDTTPAAVKHEGVATDAKDTEETTAKKQIAKKSK